MRLNWLGVILILVGIAVIASHRGGGDWFNFLLKLWPVIFIMRGFNNWEREDQSKAFQVGQIMLGSFLIADNFVGFPAIERIWDLWPVLLIAWGVSVIFGNGHRKYDFESSVKSGQAQKAKGIVIENAEPRHYRLIRELWPSTVSGETYIEFSAGMLDIGGTTDQFFEAEIDTSIGEPRILYKAESHSVLQVIQPGFKLRNMSEVPNKWNLKFTKNIPLVFKVETNAAKANIDLHEYRITNLKLEGNAGKFDVVLGDREKNVDVFFECNAGRMELVVPKTAGVEVTGECVLGSFEFKGGTLENVNGIRRTPGFDEADTKIKVKYEANASSLVVRREE